MMKPGMNTILSSFDMHETSEAVNSAAVNEIGRTPGSRGFVEHVRKTP